MRYKIVSKKFPELPKIIRACGGCNKQYEVEVMTGDYHWPSFLECDNCRLSIRYGEEIDYSLHKLFKGNISRQDVMKMVERNAPHCPRCQGRFKHVNGTTYGHPRYCPHCGVSQEECNSPLKFHPILDKDKIRYVSEEVYWLEAVQDDSQITKNP